ATDRSRRRQRRPSLVSKRSSPSMPFKFKLSKRLALMKASLAAAGVLTLACTSDLTDPQPPRNPLTQVITSADLTPLPVASVLASGDDGNIPQNTLDNNLAPAGPRPATASGSATTSARSWPSVP